MLVFHLLDLGLILDSQSLLSAVSLIPKFFNDSLYLLVSFTDHFFSHLALRLDMRVLGSLEKFAFELVMLDH